MKDKYAKQCPYCENAFIANHLSRKYCSEKCKRAAFRDKKINIRRNTRYENRIGLKNDNVLAQLYAEKAILTDEILKDNGFDFNYYLKKLKLGDGILYVMKHNYNLLIKSESIKIIKNS